MLVTKKIKRNLTAAIDWVLPPRCVVTGEIVDRQGMIAPSVWGRLNFISSPFCERCGKPFSFEADGEVIDEGASHCIGCLQHPPPFEKGRAALIYDDASRDILLRFKYADQTHIAHTLAGWLARAGAEYLGQADYLIPVPLHRWRLLKRRYNQAALLAQALQKQCGVPCLPDGLLRLRATPSQGFKNYKERHKNVRAAFAVNPRYQEMLRGKVVVLVDDVYTSGATVRECATVLEKLGVARIYSLAAARVAGSEYY